MANWETWENLKFKQDCHFKPGDRVTTGLARALKRSRFKDPGEATRPESGPAKTYRVIFKEDRRDRT